MDNEIFQLSDVETKCLHADLQEAKELLGELLSETRNLTKTSRGQKLFARIHKFIHGDRPKISAEADHA